MIAPQGMWLPGVLGTGSGSTGNGKAGVTWGVTGISGTKEAAGKGWDVLWGAREK